jgi:hypothetical protein
MAEESWRKKAKKDKLGVLSPQDMVNWLEGEIRDISREAELRIQDATDFVTAYAMGKLSEEQMNRRRSIYLSRWGEPALAGLFTTDKMSNEEILRRLDKSLPKAVQESIEMDLAELAKGTRQR